MEGTLEVPTFEQVEWSGHQRKGIFAMGIPFVFLTVKSQNIPDLWPILLDQCSNQTCGHCHGDQGCTRESILAMARFHNLQDIDLAI